MILSHLRCRKDHVFETWFRDSAAFDSQAEAGVIECPVCGSSQVEKAIMAPRLAKSSGAGAAGAPAVAEKSVGGMTPKALREAERSAGLRRALQELRRRVEENFDYVGPAFAEEARKIHYNETEDRPIYGETSDEEARDLEEEGVSVRRIPWLPRENS